jgi:hypothetical protein
VKVISALKGHKATLNNKEYLLKKINELDYWKQAKINHLEFVLSDEPQYVVLGVRGSKNDPKKPEISIAYGVGQKKGTQIITLYVNPAMFPMSYRVQLEHQYSQIALLTLFRMASWKTPKNPETTKQFISDYRTDMTNNKIFTIE